MSQTRYTFICTNTQLSLIATQGSTQPSIQVYKKEKSLKMKGDVGMACQKVHKQGRIKVMVSIQSLIHPYIFSQRSKDVGTGLCILTITFILPCLCTFWHAIPTSPFIFNDFSFLFLYFSGHLHCKVKNILIKCNQKY